MNFGQAFEQVKKGRLMRLPHWKKNVVVEAIYPQACSVITAPFLCMVDETNRVPWKESMIDLFSDEWEVVGWEDVQWEGNYITFAEICKDIKKKEATNAE